MVVFTCQNCNGCLKKKDVEKHVATKCRDAVLTCIDCVKDFDCKSYASHLTCVTESERYGGKNFVPSSAMQKQQEWIKCIADVCGNYQGNVMVKKILSYAADYPTCPRNKKKFVNFILNNKAFSKFRSNADSAFDLISNEFNKRHPQSDSKNDNSENTQQDNISNGKRKKISETEVQEETETDKSEKKLNGNSEQCKDKKKKKKNKKNSESKDEEVQENGEESVETHGKKKKKNKQRKNSENENLNDKVEDIEDDQTEVIQNDDHNEENGESNGTAVLNGVDLSKLSKKERKKLLKQQKYEAEKNSIENYKKDEDEGIVENGEGEKKAKKKKQKHADEQKDRKQKRSISEPDDKKIRLEADEEETEEVTEVIEKPKKFKWDEVIIQVLQTQGDGEMSLKRLSKKLCAEYANVYGERESYEEVLNKFHKKVQRTPGVRVLKDKAKLLATA